MLIDARAVASRFRFVHGVFWAAAALLVFSGKLAFAASGYDDPEVLAVEEVPGVPAAIFTPETLMRSFPMHQRDTATPWSAGESVVYRGPYLKDILAKYDLDQYQRIEVLAFDEYMTQISLPDIEAYRPILAVERACTMNDRTKGRCSEKQEFVPLTIADSGPYFLVWPLDKLPPSYVPGRNSLWVWFVIALRPVL